MKRLIKSEWIFVVLSLMFLIQTVNGQPNRYVNVWGGAGYNSVLHNIENTTTPGGAGYILGVGYQMDFSNFMLSAGAEFMYANSNTKLTGYNTTHDFLYNQGGTPHIITYNYQLVDFNEKYSLGYLNVPIQAGIKFSRFYAMVGAKVGLNVLGSYRNQGDLKITASDPRFIEEMEDVGHGTLTRSVDGKGKMSFDLNIAPTVEFGVYLDDWLPYSMTELNNKNRTNISYRLGAFVDYGLTDLNNSNSTTAKLITEPMGYDPGAIHMSQVSTNHLAGGEVAQNKRFNNVLAGLKLTVQFGLSEKKRKPTQQIVYPLTFHVFDAETDENLSTEVVVRYPSGKHTVYKEKTDSETGLLTNDKLRRGRYAVSVEQEGYNGYRKVFTHAKPDTFEIALKPIPKLTLHTFDVDSGKNIRAEVSVTNLENKEVNKLTTDAATGLAKQLIKVGKYEVLSVAGGYMNYRDTIEYALGDTLSIGMTPIKKEVKVILHNLFFDFDKATIKPESEPALDELYQFLESNSEIRIHITGHTDNVGREAYNQQLSLRRAQAVYDTLVERGIDKSRLSYDGKGMSDPITDNETLEGRAENRRVEFVIDKEQPELDSESEAELESASE